MHLRGKRAFISVEARSIGRAGAADVALAVACSLRDGSPGVTGRAVPVAAAD